MTGYYTTNPKPYYNSFLYLNAVMPKTYSWDKKVSFTTKANIRFLVIIFGGKRLQITLSKFPKAYLMWVYVGSTRVGQS